MTRVLLTFESLHKLLAAEKSIIEVGNRAYLVRPTPTPPEIADTVCGMSLEILSLELKESIVKHLNDSQLKPKDIHEIAD